jgi:signal peptidase I
MDLAQPEATELLVDLLAMGATARFTVTGGSMRPFLRSGETVELRTVRPSDIRRGDIVLCRRPGEQGRGLLLHRVVAIRRRAGLPSLIQTQGDALWAPDEPVAERDVLGRVCAVTGSRPAARSLDRPGPRLRGLLIALRLSARWRAVQLALRLHRAGRLLRHDNAAPAGPHHIK